MYFRPLVALLLNPFFKDYLYEETYIFWFTTHSFSVTSEQTFLCAAVYMLSVYSSYFLPKNISHIYDDRCCQVTTYIFMSGKGDSCLVRCFSLLQIIYYNFAELTSRVLLSVKSFRWRFFREKIRTHSPIWSNRKRWFKRVSDAFFQPIRCFVYLLYIRSK